MINVLLCLCCIDSQHLNVPWMTPILVDEEVTTSSNHAASDDRWDYVTPRARSVEVDVEAMAERILRTLDDEGSREEEGQCRRVCASPAVPRFTGGCRDRFPDE